MYILLRGRTTCLRLGVAPGFLTLIRQFILLHQHDENSSK